MLLSVMMNPEKILKDMNLRLARFGELDVATERPLLPDAIVSAEMKRLHVETARKLVFKIE